MRNLSILGVVVLALSLFVLNAAPGIEARAAGMEYIESGILGDEGGPSDTDYHP
jgi:hypothetical protein